MSILSEWNAKCKHIIGMMSSDSQREFMLNLGKITRCGIEVGTYKAYSLSLVAFGMASVRSSVSRKLYAIDTFQCSHCEIKKEDTLQTAKNNIKSVGGESFVEWIVEDNQTAWRHLPIDTNADWVYIDADHACDPTLQNARDYSKFVKPGGLIMFHDNDPVLFKEVVEAIRIAESEGIVKPLSQWDDFYVGVKP